MCGLHLLLKEERSLPNKTHNGRKSCQLPRQLWNSHHGPTNHQTTPQQHNIHRKHQVNDHWHQRLLFDDTHKCYEYLRMTINLFPQDIITSTISLTWSTTAGTCSAKFAMVGMESPKQESHTRTPQRMPYYCRIPPEQAHTQVSERRSGIPSASP